MNRAFRSLSLAVVAVAGLATIAACEPDPVATAPLAQAAPSTTAATTTAPPRLNVTAPPKRVAVVGDSITHSASTQLSTGFTAAQWSPSIAAKPGDMFRERMPFAADFAAARPDAAVVNLGTNDLSCALANALTPTPCRYPTFTMQDEIADADKLLALFPASTCFVGVAPSFDVPIGDHWRSLAKAGRIDGVADWHARTEAHPEYLADGLGHLTDSGRAAYARFIVAEVQRICGPAA